MTSQTVRIFHFFQCSSPYCWLECVTTCYLLLSGDLCAASPPGPTDQTWMDSALRVQIQKGQGRSERFNGPKHLSWPSRTELLPRLQEVSHCWCWRGALEFVVTPWKGLEQRTGSAQGSASIRFLFVSQVNHSQQLSPCLTVLLMCFLLTEKTSQAAPKHGEFALWQWGSGEGKTWEIQLCALTLHTRHWFP